jgi:hypothetical protein
VGDAGIYATLSRCTAWIGNFAGRSDDLTDVSSPKEPPSDPPKRPGQKKPGAKKPGSKQPADRRTAQQRLADQRAVNETARVAAVRRKKLVVAVLPVVLVVVIVAVLVIVKLSTGAGSPKSGASATTAADAVIGKVTSVPAAAFDQVGAGSVTAALVSAGAAPALTSNGLPRVFYAGAEYCPFCAAERWAVVVAMSRFGAWTGLGQTASSPSDTYPNTATLTFHGSTFNGNVVAFNGYELQSNQVVDGKYATLETLSADDQALMTKYDAPPYFSGSGSIPFVDIGGKYLISGASYDPQLLAGKTHAQIATAIADPSTAISKAVLGAANLITAAVCTLTKGAPAAVCSSGGVTAAAAKLPSVG